MGWFMSTIRKAYLAGLCIGMGGVVYLMCANMGNPYVGALIFSTGLFTILNFGLKLFTGAVGYFPDKTLPHIWLGNLLGTATVGIMMLFTRSGPALSEKAASIVAAKMADTPLSIFILSIFCGILMYIAQHHISLAVKTARHNRAVPQNADLIAQTVAEDTAVVHLSYGWGNYLNLLLAKQAVVAGMRVE